MIHHFAENLLLQICKYGAFIFLFVISSISQNLNETGEAQKYLIHIQNYTNQFTIHLDQYTPADDSCALVKISCGALQGTEFHFKCSLDRTWNYEGLATDATVLENRFSLQGIQDESGNFSELIITIFTNSDSLLRDPIEIRQNHDTRIESDTQPQAFPVSIGQYNFICEDRVIRGKTVIREFTHPAGYMRRCHELNYPELVMFHCGKGVRQPTYVYLKDIEGLLYYHILHYNNNAKYK